MQKAVFTEQAPKPRGFYSQAVQAGPFLFIAGQLPLDLDGNLIGSAPSEQAKQALQNLHAILRAAGGDWSNLVQVTIYVSDIEYWPDVNRVYQELLGHVDVAPARAVVPVKDLHYGAKVEVQAIAYLV